MATSFTLFSLRVQGVKYKNYKIKKQSGQDLSQTTTGSWRDNPRRGGKNCLIWGSEGGWENT